MYFDKYNMPQIANVEATEVTSNSITVSVTANAGDGDIVSYHYSNDNGNSYVTSNSNNYTFGSLIAETTYNISVYVTDSNGKKSDFFNIVAATTNGLIIFIVTNEDTLSSNTYYAEEDMTWYEWVASDYNNGNYRTICNMINGYVTNYEDNFYYYLLYNSSIIAGEEKIMKNGTYNYNS